LRERLDADGHVTLNLDLAPGRSLERLDADLSKPRGRRSVSEHLRRHAGIEGVKAGLIYERLSRDEMHDPQALAQRIKCLPLPLLRTRPLDEAISSAGGVRLDALSDALMLRQHPGVFCAGEMLDWDAPTGGYLLTACFASGRVAGLGAVAHLRHKGNQ
jgi:predicted flavoprotein YhiN